MLITRKQSGFGLVELMIGLAVGMIVVAAAMSLMTNALSNSNDSIKMARLDQELRQVMTMLTRDLRRATAWDASVDVARVSLVSPLTLTGTSGSVTVTSGTGNLDDIGIRAKGGTLVYKNGNTVYRGSITNYSGGAFTVTLNGTWPDVVKTPDGVPAASWGILRPESVLTVSGTCILFASDVVLSDVSGAYGTNERFGYRYDDPEDAIEVRTSGGSGDGCTSGGIWTNLTDPGMVQITAFSIDDDMSPSTLTTSGFNIDVRVYTISITGQLKADATVKRTLQETVRVRNDRLSSAS